MTERQATADNAALDPEQLAQEQAQDLPDREAMSVIGIGGVGGPLPVPSDVPALVQPDAAPQNISMGSLTPADLQDLTDVTNLTDMSELQQDMTDIQDDIRDLTDVTV